MSAGGIQPRTLAALLLVLAFVLAPHAAHLPWPLTAAAVVLGAWRWYLACRGGNLPPRWLRFVLVLAATAGVAVPYGTILGLDAGVALVVIMGALKLSELRGPRDLTVLVFIGLFLVGAELLYSQALPIAAYLLAAVWGLITVLIAGTCRTGPDAPWAHAGHAGRLVIQALPIMLVLFVLFPRISGPLWGMPDKGTAVTGLDDEMAPGTIARLGVSDAVAFRVTMAGEVPPPSQRYWRGPVLTAYDGRRWSRPDEGVSEAPPVEAEGPALAYRVTLEPHHQPWLYVLDVPAAAPEGSHLDRGLTARTEDPVRQLRRYDATSHLDYRLAPDASEGDLAPYLRLPENAHPRARELAERLRGKAAGPEAIVSSALAFLRERDFAYTLSPPTMERNWVDRFLFQERAGFCEHYAGAFAFLMRSAGVPARVVTGYLGGARNPEGDYLIVRQADAHAWTEVWLPGEGWRRVDPTTAAFPARAEGGVAESVADPGRVPDMAREGGGLLQGLRLRLDALEMAWNRWVLAYGPQIQERLLEGVGLGYGLPLAAALAGALAIAGGLVALWMIPTWRPRRDAAARLFARFERRVARHGLRRGPAEGPRAFGERAAAALPGQAEAIRGVVAAYVAVRYGGAWHRLGELRRRVRRLHLPRRRSRRQPFRQ